MNDGADDDRTAHGHARRGRPKCMPDEVRCDAIVSRARHLFVKKGYGATTTDDIATACAISKQTLYRLFPGKAALFTAVVETHRQKWLDLPRDDDEQPLGETLASIFRAEISDEADQERIDVIRLVLTEGRHFPELRAILNQYGALYSQVQLSDWLARQSHLGRLRLRDPMAAAQMLLDMVFGAILRESIGRADWPTGDARRHHIHNCIELFLNGVRA
jgi:TetR/AcrR family transcriptional repressor of mexJK operon